jgi:hypothetical protein
MQTSSGVRGMTSNANEMTKVRLRGPNGEDVEALWAVALGEDLYRLDGSPFFAYGVSWQDVVEARKKEQGDDYPEFIRCVTKSGNRTLRVFFKDWRITDSAAGIVLGRLVVMGCSYEGMQPRLACINVPPAIDLASVTRFLAAQSGLQWEYADPTCDQMRQEGLCP